MWAGYFLMIGSLTSQGRLKPFVLGVNVMGHVLSLLATYANLEIICPCLSEKSVVGRGVSKATGV
jgi:hypothetical protein